MKLYSAQQVADRLPYLGLVERLREAFAQPSEVPARSMYPIDLPGGGRAELGIMPAWQSNESIAVKLLTIFPENVAKDLPTIHAQILVFDGRTGVPVALVDGTEVTRRRTAATSALAATFLARRDSQKLLIVGTGSQAVHQALAYAAVLPIRRIQVWGRSAEKARRIAQTLSQLSAEFTAEAIEDLEAAARESDVISCLTRSGEPLIAGEWLKAGAFLDLVGNHLADRRETDDEAARRSRIYVDTMKGALGEAGELLIPLKRGVIRESDVLGDLHALCRGEVQGRRAAGEITLFKSVGNGLEDLAAACMVQAAG
jgi:ornithine cyclodeaminase